MADTKKNPETETPSKETEDMPEPLFPGEVVPENKWEERARYMREVVNPDNT